MIAAEGGGGTGSGGGVVYAGVERSSFNSGLQLLGGLCRLKGVPYSKCNPAKHNICRCHRDVSTAAAHPEPTDGRSKAEGSGNSRKRIYSFVSFANQTVKSKQTQKEE